MLSVHLLGHQSSLLSNEFSTHILATALTTRGSSTVHILTQTIHRTTQSTQTIHGTTQLTNWTTQLTNWAQLMQLIVNQAHVLRPICASEKTGVNKKGVNQKWYFHKK